MGTLLILTVLVGMGIAAAIFARKASRDRYSQARDAWKGLAAASAICFGLAVALGVYRCIIVIPPGNVGVAVLFGKVQAKPLSDGLHTLPPWYSVETMNARTQSYTMSHVIDEGAKTGDDAITVLSANGMEMKLDVTVTYRLLPEAAPWIYRNLGDNYEDRLIRPGIGTAIREAVSRFSDDEVYGAKREQLAETMLSKLDTSLQKTIKGDYEDAPTKVFSVSNVLVRTIQLPPAVTEGINRKLVMKQESERMEFQIERDKKEADRKVIEAKGIQDSQAIIARGITPDYLTWKGIEATEMLARSPNAKVIIIGNTRNGLPLILDSVVPPSPGALTRDEQEGHTRGGATSGTNNTR